MTPPFSRRDFLAGTPFGALALPWLVRRERERLQAEHPITAENRRPGTAAWQVVNVSRRHEIEGYASATSVHPGEPLALHIRSETPAYTIDVFRLGWYGGLGGRQMAGPIARRDGARHPVPIADRTGLLACDWPASHVLDVPRDWPSGVYLAKLTGALGSESGILFVVRGSQPAALLCQLPVTTYQAYNNWGGKSLYDFQSVGGRAFHVSFDRPYSVDALVGDRGFFYCDFQLVRWLESQGYDVAYCTNIDIHRERDLASRHAVYLSCGHDEYWSVEMMNHVERARDAGSHLLFLSADSCHWTIRMEQGDRVAACYKQADLDPAAPVTVRFRDPQVGRPEVALMGVQNELHCITTTSLGYTTSGEPARYRVQLPDHPLLRHTGLTRNDGFEAIVGFEWDAVYPGGPEVAVLLQCDDLRATCKYEDATDLILPAQAVAFERPLAVGRTAKTFSSGTIRWSWGLDAWQFDADARRSRVNPQLRQMTANILAWMGVLPTSPHPDLIVDPTLRQAAARVV